MSDGHADERFHAHWAERLASFRAMDRGRHLEDARVVHLPGNVPPWTETGLRVERGDALTILARGRVVTAAALGLWARPRFALWARVGPEGPVWNGAQDTDSRPAPAGGPLELALLQGEWASPAGDLATPREAYQGVEGAIDAVCLRWRGDAEAGLAALAELAPDDPLVAAERARLAHPVPRPEGWSYLWRLGDADIFTPGDDGGRPTIDAHFEDDVGILRRPVDFPLAEDTTLSWCWRVDALPSDRAEDALLHHDYLSLALELEDGRDLTWHWSACLPPGKGYACPIPTWSARETHVVVRSGPEGLGAWRGEQTTVIDARGRRGGRAAGRLRPSRGAAPRADRRGLADRRVHLPARARRRALRRRGARARRPAPSGAVGWTPASERGPPCTPPRPSPAIPPRPPPPARPPRAGTARPAGGSCSTHWAAPGPWRASSPAWAERRGCG